MKSAIKVITFADLIFIVCLIASGATEGIISEIVYYISFLLPILMLYSYLKSGNAVPSPEIGFTLKKDRSKSAGLLIFPAIATTAAVAYLTSLIMGAFGFSAAVIEKMPIYVALLTHALIPALLEEILFRYLPIKLMASHSKRLAVLLSAAAFSLCHTNLFQIPYAFIAGIILGYVTLHSGSIIPAFIIHFTNNALSVTTMLYPEASPWLFTSLGVLAAISMLFMIITRKNYGDALTVMKKGDDEAVGYSPIALIAVSLFLCITALL